MSPTLKRVLLYGGILGVLALLAWPKLPLSNDAPTVSGGAPAGGGFGQALRVSTHVATPTTLTDRVFTTGTLLANEEVVLQSEVAGIVERIAFTEGRPVRRGQLLVKINDRELQAQIRQVEFRIRLAEERERRQRALLEKGGISQEEYDITLNEVNVLRAERELFGAQLEKTELRAPFDGLIGLRSVSEGSYLAPGTPIATIQDVTPIKVEFSIPERYASRARVGSPIEFTVEGVEGAFTGEVYAFEPQIDAGTRTLTLRAIAPNPEARLLPGAFADIEMVFSEIENALTVPAMAVIPELGGKKVFVLENGAAQPRQVETGIRTDDAVQITSGLQPSDTVITSGIQQLRPGLPVMKMTSSE